MRLLRQLFELVQAHDAMAPRREAMWRLRNRAHQILSEGWAVDESVRPKVVIAISHAFDFWSWLSLAELRMTDDEAVVFMTEMVRRMAST